MTDQPGPSMARKKLRLDCESNITNIRNKSEDLDSPDTCEDKLAVVVSINNSDSKEHMDTGKIKVSKISTNVDTDDTQSCDDISSTVEDSTTYCDTSSRMKNIPFTKQNKFLVTPADDVKYYFDLFMNEDYLNTIVEGTNYYARKLKNMPSQQPPRINTWKDITKDELIIFLGLLLHTGTMKMNRITDYWKGHRLFKSSFPQYISRNRFLSIMSCLHFTSVDDDHDQLTKIHPVINNFNSVMKNIYYPGKELCINESMILLRDQLFFRHQLKGKHLKSDFQLYELVEPDGTILQLELTEGVPGLTSNKYRPDEIVFKLLDQKLDEGHSIYMDYYFNSYELAVKLLKQNTYCNGILYKNQKDNPESVVTAILKGGDNISVCLNGVHMGKWMGKKNILYISTEFDDEMQEDKSKHGITYKPVVIINYNTNISKLNLQPKMLSFYPCEKMAMTWYRRIFIHTLMMSLTNAHTLYNKFSGNPKISFYDFRLRIIENLLPDIEIGISPVSNVLTLPHKLTKIENYTRHIVDGGRNLKVRPRKDCRNCSIQKKRIKYSNYRCKGCAGCPVLCIECFFEIHT